MAVTISLEQLADHLRLDRDAINSGDPRRTIVIEAMQASVHHVEGYAPEAPVDVQNMAVARMVGYLYDAPPANPSRNVSTPESGFRNSGAKSLLSPWRTISFALVDGSTSTSTTTNGNGDTTGETDLDGSTPVTPAATRYFAVKTTDDFTASDYLSGVEFTGTRITIPPFTIRSFFGVALEHGKTLHALTFDPDGSAQLVTGQWSEQPDIVIAGEPYSPWDSNGVYFPIVAGFDIEFDIEDV